MVRWNLFLMAKQGQEQISPNLVQRLFPISVMWSIKRLRLCNSPAYYSSHQTGMITHENYVSHAVGAPPSNSITDQLIELFVPWIAKGERGRDGGSSDFPRGRFVLRDGAVDCVRDRKWVCGGGFFVKSSWVVKFCFSIQILRERAGCVNML